MSRHESGKTLNILRTLGIETEKVTLPHVSKASASTVVERQVKLEMQGSEARCGWIGISNSLTINWGII